jgi:hypothetical protein
VALTSYRRQFSGSSLALRNVGAREAVLPGSGHGVPSGSVSYTELAATRRPEDAVGVISSRGVARSESGAKRPFDTIMALFGLPYASAKRASSGCPLFESA